jgi:hypothetical protein
MCPAIADCLLARIVCVAKPYSFTDQSGEIHNPNIVRLSSFLPAENDLTPVLHRTRSLF